MHPRINWKFGQSNPFHRLHDAERLMKFSVSEIPLDYDPCYTQVTIVPEEVGMPAQMRTCPSQFESLRHFMLWADGRRPQEGLIRWVGVDPETGEILTSPADHWRGEASLDVYLLALYSYVHQMSGVN